MLTYHGAYVKLTGVMVSATPTTGTKAYSVSVALDSKTITLRVDPKLVSAAAFTALNTKFDGISVNAVINVRGIMTAFGYSSSAWNPQIQILSADDITASQLSGENAVSAVKKTLALPGTVWSEATTLSLPTSITNNPSTISWASSEPTIIATNGTVTHPTTDTMVTLTATITEGSSSDTATFKALVIGTANPTATVLYTTGFEENQDGGQYGQSGIKQGYAAGSAVFATKSWMFANALHGGSASDKPNGDWAVRLKPIADNGYLAMEWNETNIKYVEFSATAYGSHTPGEVIVSYSTDDGTTWTEATVRCAMTSTRQSYRVYLNLTGAARIKIEHNSPKGNNAAIDDIKICSVA